MITSRSSVAAPGSIAPRAATPRLRLGTRGSALAVAQSSTIVAALRELGAEVELVTIRTLGDDRPPDTTWGEGAFVGALETGLLDGSIDIAVHSAKDVPTTEHPDLTIAAYPPRADPRDALVGRGADTTLESLPRGARVGTDSPRRSAFLRTLRPDLLLHSLHGNVDTRLRRLDEGGTDALVLAVAGLTRLGRAERIGQVLPVELCPPAPGQGALAIQCRANDGVTRAWLTRLDDESTRAAVEAERAFLRATGGGCRAPIGASATIAGDQIVLRAATAGTIEPRDDAPEPPALASGEVRGAVADRLHLAAGLAARLTAELAGRAGTGAPRSAGSPSRVLVTRAESQAGGLLAGLAERGLAPVAIPTIEIRPVEADSELDAAVLRAVDSSWIAVTSANAVSGVLDAAARLGADLGGVRWAAVGAATRAALEARGIGVAFVPTVPDAASLAAELPLQAGDTIVVPRADIADPRFVARLEARGARVQAVVAYRTLEGPESSRGQLRALFASGTPAAIVFTSGSTVRGLVALLGSSHLASARRTVVCCIGVPTAIAARTAGFEHILVGAGTDAQALADLVRTAVPAPAAGPTAALAPAGRPEDLA